MFAIIGRKIPILVKKDIYIFFFLFLLYKNYPNSNLTTLIIIFLVDILKLGFPLLISKCFYLYMIFVFYLGRRIIVESEILKLASSQGIWAALSVALIFYILKAQEKRDIRQEEREVNYQKIISKLTDKFNIVEDVKRDVEDIKEFVFKKEK